MTKLITNINQNIKKRKQKERQQLILEDKLIRERKRQQYDEKQHELESAIVNLLEHPEQIDELPYQIIKLDRLIVIDKNLKNQLKNEGLIVKTHITSTPVEPTNVVYILTSRLQFYAFRLSTWLIITLGLLAIASLLESNTHVIITTIVLPLLILVLLLQPD